MIMLEDREKSLEKIINSLDNKTKEKLRLFDNQEVLLLNIRRISDRIVHRRINIWDNGELAETLDMIEKVLREAFADISAILVLDLCYEDILEAFVISEGCVINEVLITPFLVNRIALVKSIMEEKQFSKWKKRSKIVNKKKNIKEQKEDQSKSKEFRNKLKLKVDQYLQSFEKTKKSSLKDEPVSLEVSSSEVLIRNLLYCEDIFKIEKKYLSECYDQLKIQLESEDIIDSNKVNSSGKSRKERIQMVRNVFRHFAVYDISAELSFKQLFDDYDILEDWYEGYVSSIKE